jgi:NAD(P) transhydrogenase subunit alpha
VAGLQAIATARRLGAFVEQERRLLARHVAEADVVITTAQVPGRPAPRLVTEDMVRGMRPGSVVVDLASESGGNCDLTHPGEVAAAYGVTIHGETNVPGLMPAQASLLYGRTVAALIRHLAPGGDLALDFEDEIVREACVSHAGRALGPVAEELSA